jgi:lysozyme family protein
MKKFVELFRKKASVLVLALMAFVVPFAASAQTAAVDVSGVVSAIEAAAAPIASIGAAVLLILVGIKVYKWVRRAM